MEGNSQDADGTGDEQPAFIEDKQNYGWTTMCATSRPCFTDIPFHHGGGRF